MNELIWEMFKNEKGGGGKFGRWNIILTYFPKVGESMGFPEWKEGRVVKSGREMKKQNIMRLKRQRIARSGFHL